MNGEFRILLARATSCAMGGYTIFVFEGTVTNEGASRPPRLNPGSSVVIVPLKEDSNLVAAAQLALAEPGHLLGIEGEFAVSEGGTMLLVESLRAAVATSAMPPRS